MAGYLEEQEWLKTVSPNPTSLRTTAHENKTFSTQHHFQAIQQVQEYPFQIAQVVWAYSRYLGWLLLLSGGLSCLRIFWKADFSQSVFQLFLQLTHAGEGPISFFEFMFQT